MSLVGETKQIPTPEPFLHLPPSKCNIQREDLVLLLSSALATKSLDTQGMGQSSS